MRISFEKGAPSTAAQLVGGGVGVTAQAYTWQWWLGWALFVFGFTLFLWGVRWDKRPWWLSLHKPSNPFARSGSLYTGIVCVSDSELDTKHYFDLSVRAFNGSPYSFQTMTIAGTVKVDFSPIGGGSTRDGFVLPAPILYFESEKPHKPDAEFVLGTRLFLSAEQVAEYRKQQAGGYIAHIMLQALKVELETKRGKRMRLPLWDGVSLGGSRIAVGQIHAVSFTASASVETALGT